jgi:hypothetical protein
VNDFSEVLNPVISKQLPMRSTQCYSKEGSTSNFPLPYLEIEDNPKIYLFFKDILAAIDGTQLLVVHYLMMHTHLVIPLPCRC